MKKRKMSVMPPTGRPETLSLILVLALSVAAPPSAAIAQEGDPPARVARLGYMEGCDQTAKYEANSILVPFGLPKGRRIDFDSLNLLQQGVPSPNAVANQTGIEQIVTQSALGL